VHSAFCNVEFCKPAASRVQRASPVGETTITLLLAWSGSRGTAFYSRLNHRRRHRLSICILCHKCENRFESDSFRGNVYQIRETAAQAVRVDENRELAYRDTRFAHVNYSYVNVIPRHREFHSRIRRSIFPLSGLNVRLKDGFNVIKFMIIKNRQFRWMFDASI